MFTTENSLFALKRLVSSSFKEEYQAVKTHFTGGSLATILPCVGQISLLVKLSISPCVVDSERLSSRTSFQIEDEVLDTSKP